MLTCYSLEKHNIHIFVILLGRHVEMWPDFVESIAQHTDSSLNFHIITQSYVSVPKNLKERVSSTFYTDIDMYNSLVQEHIFARGFKRLRTVIQYVT